GHILGFSEKTEEAGPAWINAGIYLLQTRLLLTIPEGTPVSLERETFPSWVGRRFYGYRTPAAFLDIGTPDSYARAASFFRDFDTAAPARHLDRDSFSPGSQTRVGATSARVCDPGLNGVFTSRKEKA